MSPAPRTGRSQRRDGPSSSDRSRASRSSSTGGRPRKGGKRGRAPRRRGARGAPRHRVLWASLGALVLLLVTALVLLFLWTTRRPHGASSDNVRLEIDSSHPGSVAEELARQGLVESVSLMEWSLRIFSLGDSVTQRVHVLSRGSSPRELMAQLFERRQRPHAAVTVVEGWNIWQVAEVLSAAGVCDEDAFLRAATDRELLQRLSVPGSSAEGYLFPATYPLQRNTAPERVLSRLVQEAHRRLERALEKAPLDRDVARLGLTRHELLTLASLVEEETGRDGERGRIARVFVNRMLHPEVTGGRLQSDPTARYGCHLMPQLASCDRAEHGVTPAMLRDPNNPYNTYRKKGLPPGPISSPGEAALDAAIRPPSGREFFFVANGEGGHVFSNSFREHRAAVAKLRSKRGKSF